MNTQENLLCSNCTESYLPQNDNIQFDSNNNPTCPDCGETLFFRISD